MALVPSRTSNCAALVCDLARSTSATVGETDIRVHSRRVKCNKSSTLLKLKVSTKVGMCTMCTKRNVLLGDQVDTPETSVGVVCEEMLVRVGEVVGGHNVAELGAEQWRGTETTVPVTEDGRHDEHRPVVRAPPSDGFDGEGNVEGVHRVVSDSDFGTGEDRGGSGLTAEGDGVGRGGEGSKVLLGELDELFVGNSTGTDETHSVGGVVVANESGEVITGHVLDVLLWAEDGVSKLLVWGQWERQGGAGEMWARRGLGEEIVRQGEICYTHFGRQRRGGGRTESRCGWSRHPRLLAG